MLPFYQCLAYESTCSHFCLSSHVVLFPLWAFDWVCVHHWRQNSYAMHGSGNIQMFVIYQNTHVNKKKFIKIHKLGLMWASFNFFLLRHFRLEKWWHTVLNKNYYPNCIKMHLLSQYWCSQQSSLKQYHTKRTAILNHIITIFTAGTYRISRKRFSPRLASS